MSNQTLTSSAGPQPVADEWPPPARRTEAGDAGSWPHGPQPPPTPPPPGRRRGLGAVRWVPLLVAASAAGYAGGRVGAPGRSEPPPPAGLSAAVAPPSAPAAPSDLAALYRRLAPTVVQVLPGGQEGEGSGSGVIIDAGGVVLTNRHVVAGTDSAVLVLADGRRLTGRVAGTDPQFDLAVIRVSAPPDGLVAAPLGDSDRVQPGDVVLAIGAPFGLPGSLTTGVVSAVNRTFAGNRDYPPMRGLIQTDAAINPGNSGGPLFSAGGELIGITTAIESPVRGSVGVGFAVPINRAREAMPTLVSGGTVERPYLGIQGDAAPGGGVRVEAVGPGTPADAAGLQPGDVILSVDGVPVGSIDELGLQILQRRVGDTVSLVVRRGDRTLTLAVHLAPFRGGDR